MMALRHSLFLDNTTRGRLAVPVFLCEFFDLKLCGFLFVLFQLIKMQIQLFILDSAVQPSQVVGHGIQDVFCIYILRSAAEESGKSAVTFDVSKSAFRLNAPVHAEHLSFLGIDEAVFFLTQFFKQSGYGQFLVPFFQRFLPVLSRQTFFHVWTSAAGFAFIMGSSRKYPDDVFLVFTPVFSIFFPLWQM